MSLRQFEYALAVAEEGSVTAAAELPHVAQPSVSQQIRALERARCPRPSAGPSSPWSATLRARRKRP